MILAIEFALFSLLVAGCTATDYCDKKLCPDGGIHIGCLNKNKLVSNCRASHLFLQNRETLTKWLVHLHNECRNFIAGGNTRLKPAVRMPLLKWNKELAQLAENNAKRCNVKYDECRNTRSFPFVGQNISYLKGRLSTREDDINYKVYKKMLSGMLDNWCPKTKVPPQAWIDKYPANESSVFVDHFTNIIQDQTTDIGCSGIQYISPHNNEDSHFIILLVCNYSFKSMMNYPVYIKGPTAQKCKTGRDSTYKALCSSKESFSFNFEKYKKKTKLTIKKRKCKNRKRSQTKVAHRRRKHRL